LDARGEVRGVLDIDSDILGAFDAVDQEELEGLAAVVSKVYV
jgi:putative methionine-R-sulfoxide reductase with GAF domain